nr:hypothetical protein [Paraburkholderia sp. BCC1885]
MWKAAIASTISACQVSVEEFQRELPSYSEIVGLAADGKTFTEDDLSHRSLAVVAWLAPSTFPVVHGAAPYIVDNLAIRVDGPFVFRVVGRLP